MRSLRLGCAIGALMIASTAAYAQETTGTIRGDVVDEAGSPIANATVTVLHTPTGSRSTSTTDASGTFSSSGLRIGGPYEVTATAPGLETATATIPNITSGSPQRISITLVGAGETITVTGTRVRSSIELATGPATALNQDAIQGVASVTRDIRDLVRRDPYATLDLTNRSISIAGQNSRFNKFSVDGVQFSDDFGINQGGLPTQRGPVPLDAICEFTVQVAPSDITEGDFQGGAINTVLCSGTNEFHGSAFGTYSDDSLTGSRTRGRDVPLDFDSKTYGFQLRGPIIRDVLFFSVTGERLREGRPADFGPQNEGFANAIPNLTRTIVDRVKNTARTLYNYDTLDVPTSVEEKDDKLVAKFDLNIGENHRAAATYIYNDSSNFQDTNAAANLNASNPSLGLQSNSYELTERVHSGVFQLNSDWSDDFSTEARISYRDYKRGQVPYNGRSFGQFNVCTNATSDASSPTTTPPGNGGGTTGCNTGVPRVVFGPDASRQANALDTSNLDIQLQANLSRNNHNVKAIFARNEIDVNNLFAQNTSGSFYFDSLADYEARRANQLVLNVPINGDLSSVAGIFDYVTWTFGIQDTWDVLDNLTVQYGFRADLYDQEDRPAPNQFFVQRLGYGNNETLSGKYLFSPRFGLTWQPLDRLDIRASVGRFGGGTPDVYVSNSFSNTGVASNQVTISRNANGTFTGAPTDIAAAALNNVGGGTAIPSVVTQFAQTNTASVARAQVNALAPDFEIPSTWRYSLSASYDADLGPLGDNWLLGVDLLYSEVDRGLQVTDARAVQIGTLPDGRPRYGQRLPAPADNNGDYILFNSKAGRTKVAVVRFDKEWDFGLSAGGSYTWQDATAVSELTSSTATSNYNQTASSNPNFAVLGTSNTEIKHQFKFNVGFRRNFFGDNETRLDIFGETRSGRPFSYTGEDAGSTPRSAVFGVLGDDRRHLLYVPTGPNDPLVEYAASGSGATAQTAAQTASLLDAFINGSELGDYRGKIAPKNIGRSPWFTKIDLRLSQDIPLIRGTKIKAFVDVENVLNLIDSDWGSLRQVGFPYFANVVQVSCAAFGTGTAANNCLRYRYTNFQNPAETLETRVSLYQIRVGARFEF